MVNLVLPTKYAEALFEITKETGSVTPVRGELYVIKKVLDMNEKLKKVIYHPGISRDEKKTIVKNIFGEQLSKTTVNFLMFLIDKKREKLFDAICEIFSEKADDYLGIKKITIETAYRLEEAEKEKLVKQLEGATKKKLKVDARVNAGMLGGIIIRERMKLIDASVIQFLNTLKSRLHSVKVGDNRTRKKPSASAHRASADRSGSRAKKARKKPSASARGASADRSGSRAKKARKKPSKTKKKK